MKLHQKNNLDAMRNHWRLMQGKEAILVLNQKIFLYNPIPEIPFYKTEIEAVKPVILNGDLSRIK